MTPCLNCDGWGCAQCALEREEARGGEQGLSAAELELVKLRTENALLSSVLKLLLANLSGNFEHHPDLCSRTTECDGAAEGDEGCSYCGDDDCPECECGLDKTLRALAVARAAIAEEVRS